MVETKIQSSPKYYSEGGCPTQNQGEHRNDRCIEEEAAQDGCQGRSEEGSQRRTPKLFGVGNYFLVEEPKG